MKWLLALAVTLAILPLGCVTQQPPTTVVYSLPELKYRLLSSFGDVFYCDPDLYPVAREGQEEKNALEQFSAIKTDTAEFAAILKQLGLPEKAEYSSQEKVLIYREHKKLQYGVETAVYVDIYSFALRVGEGQGQRISGTITPSGDIEVLNQEVSFNTCPICLAKGTIIDTPNGQVPVEQLRQGMIVWTIDESRKRVAAPVVETVVTPVPPSFRVVRVVLDDGRIVTASPTHPSAEGRALGDYQIGDILDGAHVVAMEYIAYGDGATYDFLPDGGTGVYWANGILLKSTLAIHK